MMTDKIKRYPIKHFFIMDRVQKTFIVKTLIIVCAVSMLTLLSVIFMYYLKYRTGYFYYMTESMDAGIPWPATSRR